MTHTELNSSHLKSAGYNSELMLLEVKFKSGKTYRFQGVPQEAFDGLCAAESCGKFFGQHVKGKFESVQVEQKETEEV